MKLVINKLKTSFTKKQKRENNISRSSSVERHKKKSPRGGSGSSKNG